ncbi:hypothetical protein TcCL_Unassigned01630 [Trypanosoma cruzi]|nr:hypothetical protein TcCL_Unassigned01630 [Trypanosoma cruzi]
MYFDVPRPSFYGCVCAVRMALSCGAKWVALLLLVLFCMRCATGVSSSRHHHCVWASGGSGEMREELSVSGCQLRSVHWGLPQTWLLLEASCSTATTPATRFCGAATITKRTTKCSS